MKKVKEILKRKITFLFKNLYSDNFDVLFVEFGTFAFNTPELADIVRTIVEAGKVSKSYLEFVIMHFMVSQSVHGGRGKEIIKPLFYSDTIEKEYHLIKDFYDLVQSELDAIKRGEKMGIDETSPFPVHERRKEFYHVEKLYFDIIEEIDLRELRAKKSSAAVTRTTEAKLDIVIDRQKGIYDATKQDRIYEISGKRMKIVEYLSQHNTAPLSDLAGCTGQTDALLVKEIRAINDNFKGNLALEDALILHSKTSGYRLNRERFSIETPT